VSLNTNLPSSESLIHNVSDTALWVATYRGWESTRKDALFVDPFAARLAGERGEAMARNVPRSAGMGNGWPIVARTRIIDDYINASLAEGCDCVLNLAAGLDTRPYRLKLPKTLLWIEVDLPDILAYKQRLLVDEIPNCVLERRSIDLNDVELRGRLLDEVAERAKRVLVLTEGLVLYLEREAVSQLGRDLALRPQLRWWTVDMLSPAILSRLQRASSEHLANAPMKFAVSNGVAFFEELGWKSRDIRSLFHEAARMHRVPWYLRVLALLPNPDDRNPGQRPWSAVVRFERP
jgi:methyltransferase (TIGR00027 family)